MRSDERYETDRPSADLRYGTVAMLAGAYVAVGNDDASRDHVGDVLVVTPLGSRSRY